MQRLIKTNPHPTRKLASPLERERKESLPLPLAPSVLREVLGKGVRGLGLLCLFLLLASYFLLLTGCGEEATLPPTFQPPTAPPTPIAFDSVPPAATVGGGRTTQAAVTVEIDTAPPPTPTPISDDDDTGRGFINADSTALAAVFGTPGPGQVKPGGSGKPSGVRPTPTLNLSPGQTNIASLRTSRVSFLFAYRQAFARVQAVQRQARLVFASATVLRPERTIWNFFFVWPEGRKMWRIVFDANASQPQPGLELTEVAPSMLADAGQIDMTRVLDGDELVSRAEGAGLRVSLPIDVVNFQLDGISRLPSFVLTNSPQGKQVVINAYTGQVIRSDFGG